MLHDLIEKYPQINYVLFGMAIFQVYFFLYIALDLLREQKDCEKKEPSIVDAKKLKAQ